MSRLGLSRFCRRWVQVFVVGQTRGRVEGQGVEAVPQQYSTLNIAARSLPVLTFSLNYPQLQYFPPKMGRMV